MENSIKKDSSKVKNHLPWIDALRFIAAFMVMFCHSRNDFFVKYDQLDASQQGIGAFVFYTLGRLGPEAVFVFFIISGFLVGGIGLERIMNGSFRVKDYTINRAVRIGLPLIGAIVLYGIVAPIVGESWDWITAIGNLLNLQCILVKPLVSPFWSLSYEVWFYIFLASIALVFFRHKVLGMIMFLICCLVYTKMNSLYLVVLANGGCGMGMQTKEIQQDNIHNHMHRDCRFAWSVADDFGEQGDVIQSSFG